MRIHKISFFLPTLVFTSCASAYISTIESSSYDEAKNETIYSVLPLGTTAIPGKWEKGRKNNVSGQQFFHNKDSVELAISFHRCNDYSFNKNNKHKGFAFTKAFYEWDSQYFIDTYGLKRTMLEEDPVNKYVLYRIYGVTNKTEVDTYFLIAENNGNASNFSISQNKKWTEQEKIKFLKNLLPKKAN